MAWTAKQVQLAVMACRQAGIDDAARKLILRQFPHALFNRQGIPVSDPSSTSARLDNADFEDFMAIVEDRAGGKILHFTPGYFGDKVGSRSVHANERMGSKIRELYRAYLLQGDGRYRLEGLVWRFSAQRTSQVDELKPREAWNLIEMLKNLRKSQGVASETSGGSRKVDSEDEVSGTSGASGGQGRLFSPYEYRASPAPPGVHGPSGEIDPRRGDSYLEDGQTRTPGTPVSHRDTFDHARGAASRRDGKFYCDVHRDPQGRAYVRQLTRIPDDVPLEPLNIHVPLTAEEIPF